MGLFSHAPQTRQGHHFQTNDKLLYRTSDLQRDADDYGGVFFPVLVNRAHRKCRKRPAHLQLQDDYRDLTGAGLCARSTRRTPSTRPRAWIPIVILTRAL